MFRSGVAAFIIRMANDIPSGYEPQVRIITTIRPMPIRYSFGIVIPKVGPPTDSTQWTKKLKTNN